MFRKFLLTAVAGLGLLSPLAVAPATEAHEFRHEHRHAHHDHVYRVFYSDPCRSGWVFAGTFHERRDAVRFAETYRCRGFAISIR